MADRSLARRYARAFIEIAQESNRTDKLGEQLSAVLGAFRAHDAMLLNAFSNPVYTVTERTAVLEDVLPKLGLEKDLANLLRLMLRNDRMSLLPEVVDSFIELADEAANRVRVVVETAEPLGPQLEAEVRAALEKVTGKTVLIQTRVDASLIGGLVARVGGKVYDASVRNRLQTLRQTLLSASVAEA